MTMTFCFGLNVLTHWSRVTCISVLANLSSLAQIITCRMDSAKAISEPMLEYYLSGINLNEIKIKIYHFY